MISSTSFIGHPGNVFARDMWNLPSFFMLPVVLVFIARRVVVFYRRTVSISGNGRIVLPTISATFTNIHVKSLLASAGVVEIQSVPGPGTYPLISYESAAPTLSLSLPAGFYGIVKDNTGNKTIDAQDPRLAGQPQRRLGHHHRELDRRRHPRADDLHRRRLRDLR